MNVRIVCGAALSLMSAACSTATSNWQPIGQSNSGVAMDYAPAKVRREGALIVTEVRLIDYSYDHPQTFTVATMQIDCAARRVAVVGTEVRSMRTGRPRSKDRGAPIWEPLKAGGETLVAERICPVTAAATR